MTQKNSAPLLSEAPEPLRAKSKTAPKKLSPSGIGDKQVSENFSETNPVVTQQPGKPELIASPIFMRAVESTPRSPSALLAAKIAMMDAATCDARLTPTAVAVLQRLAFTYFNTKTHMAYPSIGRHEDDLDKDGKVTRRAGGLAQAVNKTRRAVIKALGVLEANGYTIVMHGGGGLPREQRTVWQRGKRSILRANRYQFPWWHWAVSSDPPPMPDEYDGCTPVHHQVTSESGDNGCTSVHHQLAKDGCTAVHHKTGDGCTSVPPTPKTPSEFSFDADSDENVAAVERDGEHARSLKGDELPVARPGKQTSNQAPPDETPEAAAPDKVEAPTSAEPMPAPTARQESGEARMLATVFAKEQHTATRGAEQAALNQLAGDIGWDKILAMGEDEVGAAVAKLTMQPTTKGHD